MKIFRPKLKNKMEGVFYWISPGQIWVADCLDVKWESEGIISRFVPWSKFADPFEDLEYNEALNGVEKYAETKISSCSNCHRTRKQVEEIKFELKNDIAQPWIHGVGEAFIHSAARQLLESNGFKGFRYVSPSRGGIGSVDSNSSLQLDYFYLDAMSVMSKVPGVIADGEETCPRCRSVHIACQVCGEVPTRCLGCNLIIMQEEVHTVDLSGNRLNGSEWPARLASWNLDDAVGGVNWFAVTGELLEFLIANDIAPFAFGSIDVNCDGASAEQLEHALKVRRDIPIIN